MLRSYVWFVDNNQPEPGLLVHELFPYRHQPPPRTVSLSGTECFFHSFCNWQSTDSHKWLNRNHHPLKMMTSADRQASSPRQLYCVLFQRIISCWFLLKYPTHTPQEYCHIITGRIYKIMVLKSTHFFNCRSLFLFSSPTMSLFSLFLDDWWLLLFFLIRGNYTLHLLLFSFCLWQEYNHKFHGNKFEFESILCNVRGIERFFCGVSEKNGNLNNSGTISEV